MGFSLGFSRRADKSRPSNWTSAHCGAVEGRVPPRPGHCRAIGKDHTDTFCWMS